MNYQKEYYKYKKMYLNLKKINQSAGKFLVGPKDQNGQNTRVFTAETEHNHGVPRDGEQMQNQCMLISISDFLKTRGQNVTVRELRIVGGLDSRSEYVEFDEGWLHSVTALENIAKHYNIRISVYESIPGLINERKIILPLYDPSDPTQTYILPTNTYTSTGIIPTIQHSSINMVNPNIASNTVHILHSPGHFELIKKVFNNNTTLIYDLESVIASVSKLTIPIRFITMPATAPTEPNPYTTPPVEIEGVDIQISKQIKQTSSSGSASVPVPGSASVTVPGSASASTAVPGSESVKVSASVTVPGSLTEPDSVDKLLDSNLNEISRDLTALISVTNTDISNINLNDISSKIKNLKEKSGIRYGNKLINAHEKIDQLLLLSKQIDDLSAKIQDTPQTKEIKSDLNYQKQQNIKKGLNLILDLIR